MTARRGRNVAATQQLVACRRLPGRPRQDRASEEERGMWLVLYALLGACMILAWAWAHREA